jgi:hypothetical protein
MIEDFKILAKYETSIFNNLDSFTSRFCKGDVFDLYAVYFSTESVSIHYILDGKSLGQHVGDSFKLTEFMQWYTEIADDKV